jgi:cytochrome c oxidase subunit 3
MWVALASISMLFTALSSAYIVRAGSSNDWVSIAMPKVLLLSTVLILVSSITLEVSRRNLKSAAFSGYGRWLLITMLLGLGFLAAQLLAWKQLARQGVYLSQQSAQFVLLSFDRRTRCALDRRSAGTDFPLGAITLHEGT